MEGFSVWPSSLVDAFLLSAYLRNDIYSAVVARVHRGDGVAVADSAPGASMEYLQDSDPRLWVIINVTLAKFGQAKGTLRTCMLAAFSEEFWRAQLIWLVLPQCWRFHSKHRPTYMIYIHI